MPATYSTLEPGQASLMYFIAASPMMSYSQATVAMKLPVILIVGEKDAKENKVSVRLKDKEEVVSLNRLAEYLTKM